MGAFVSAGNVDNEGGTGGENTIVDSGKKVNNWRAPDGGPAMWRCVKGPSTINREGKTWHWCSKHKSDKFKYDGLYVTHKEEEYRNWLKRKL